MKAQQILMYALIALFIALGFWWEVSSWVECRETNSFWYCLRILGK